MLIRQTTMNLKSNVALILRWTNGATEKLFIIFLASFTEKRPKPVI